ncbi:MAG: glutamine amidotransferase [Actinobacteria bacterium]|nr:glutamine amidotransferase [Actinomycetota bacterium]
MTSAGPVLRLAYLYPDLMNLYADRGNVICLQRRCAWRGITLTVDRIEWGDHLTGIHDLYLIGGGQDRQQQLASEGLTRHNADALLRALGDGAAMLAVCGGYQLMARAYRAAHGAVLPGLGVFDAETVHPGPKARRCIGNLVCRWDRGYLAGFENHGGRTYLGAGVKPLAQVIRGFGNNAQDGTEGAAVGHAIGTYLHGSVLPKNPELADHLLRLALARAAPGFSLAPLDDRIELAAHQAALAAAGVAPPARP